jgi:threonine dehydrogenase-like Zn-dependent dehydrogenase
MNETMGVQREGAYAEYIVIPKEHILHNLVNLEPKLLALTEPFAVGFHAIGRVEIKPEETVLIFGAGPIGLFCLISAINRKAKVSIADPHNSKLEIAKILGAYKCVNSKTNNMYDFFHLFTWGEGYDICIDATGSKEAIKYCFEFVRTGGKVVLIGHSKEDIPMPHSDIIKKELTIYASRNSLNLTLTQNEIKKAKSIDKVITNIIPFSEVPKFYERLVLKDERIIKALIEF